MKDTDLSSVEAPQLSVKAGLPIGKHNALTMATRSEKGTLRQVWFSLKHRGPLVLAVAVALTAVAGIWVWRQTPLYQGRFRLLMGSSLSQAPTMNPSLLAGGENGQLDVATQIAVLQSDPVLKPIIRELQKQYSTIDYDRLMGLG